MSLWPSLYLEVHSGGVHFKSMNRLGGRFLARESARCTSYPVNTACHVITFDTQQSVHFRLVLTFCALF